MNWVFGFYLYIWQLCFLYGYEVKFEVANKYKGEYIKLLEENIPEEEIKC
jgi:hypothetical protein